MKNKIKNTVKKTFAVLICIIMLLTSIAICIPTKVVETSKTEQNIEEKITLDISNTDKIIVSSRSLMAQSRAEHTIYELVINNNTKLYFENENEANEKKQYLINNTDNLSVFVDSVVVEDKNCLTTNEESNKVINEYIGKYKKNKVCFPTISHNVSSSYGYRQSRGDFHTGLDLSGNYGDNIYSYKDGKVIKVQYSQKSYGNMVLLEHKDGTQTRYAHMSSIMVVNGQFVSCGETIGKMGSTGNSTGNHLHFEIIKNGKTVNPYNYIF